MNLGELARLTAHKLLENGLALGQFQAEGGAIGSVGIANDRHELRQFQLLAVGVDRLQPHRPSHIPSHLLRRASMPKSLAQNFFHSPRDHAQRDRNHWTVQPFLDVRIAVLNNTHGGSFRRLYPAFQAENDNHSALVAA
jgi:hypothetical protein